MVEVKTAAKNVQHVHESYLYQVFNLTSNNAYTNVGSICAGAGIVRWQAYSMDGPVGPNLSHPFS